METLIEKIIEKAVKFRLWYTSTTDVKLIQYANSKSDPWPTKIIRNKLHLDLLIVNGFKCFVASNKKVKSNDSRILYIHGDTYVKEINQINWLYVASLIKHTNAVVYVPIYPLTNNKYSAQLDTNKFLLDLYRKITTSEPQCKWNIIGCSAGGGYALVLSQQIKVHKILKPRNLILLSPIVSMDIIHSLEDFPYNDPIFPRDLLNTVLQWQLRGHNPKNPLFSPIYGDNNNLVDGGGIVRLHGRERNIYVFH